jgi:hypothetical protein
MVQLFSVEFGTVCGSVRFGSYFGHSYSHSLLCGKRKKSKNVGPKKERPIEGCIGVVVVWKINYKGVHVKLVRNLTFEPSLRVKTKFWGGSRSYLRHLKRIFFLSVFK